MKAVQFTIDPELLRRIDADPEVKQKGRSAFLRHAVEEYLRRKQEDAIDASYRRAYGRHTNDDDDLLVAPELRAWPDDWK